MDTNKRSNDRNFNDLATKFEKNIYGTSKGRLRHEILLHNLQPFISDGRGKAALDAGGGTGELSKALLACDFNVMLNDVSDEVLEIAKHKLRDNTALEIHHGSIMAISTDIKFDFIACHAVLEWLESPFNAIEKLLSQLNEKGILSLSFFNHDANLFGNLLYGNFELVKNNMRQKNRVRLAAHSPLKPKEVIDFLNTMPCEIKLVSGIRCFHDYLKDKSQQETEYQALKEMELKYCKQEPFLWLGKYFHIVVEKI